MRPMYRFVGSILTMLMLAPSLAFAQGAIAGLVKDTSGAVLPASPSRPRARSSSRRSALSLPTVPGSTASKTYGRVFTR